MRLDQFDFELPQKLIARYPAENREDSKLMVVDRRSGAIHHSHFKEIGSYLESSDFFVFNNSRVIPAKLFGEINNNPVELLIIKKLDDVTAEVFALPAKRFKVGTEITFDRQITAKVEALGDMGRRRLRFNRSYSEVLEIGYAPLPPYIKRKRDEAKQNREFDLSRYQTLYSKDYGSIAAPTAGLHFSDSLISRLKQRHQCFEISLHVGTATFQTIKTDDIEDHKMGIEHISIPDEVSKGISTAKQDGNLLAVGTTSVRSLETFARLETKREHFQSELFIYPGFEFRMVDKLVTNFHLPKSSLFILVCSFGGIELMEKAYAIAVEKKYRFFSYGDAMLII